MRFSKRHLDDEYVDEINIKIVPRFKTSDLSGDEWRISAVVEFIRKGDIVWERTFSNMEAACNALPWFFMTMYEQEDLELLDRDVEDTFCYQPGCQSPAVSTYNLKKEYSIEGFEGGRERECYRRFCTKHLNRGDCGLEDADRNYDVEGPGPNSQWER